LVICNILRLIITYKKVDFTPIHSFHNGIGRMGRILANAILTKGGLPQISVVIENKWKHRRALEESKVNPNAMKEYWF